MNEILYNTIFFLVLLIIIFIFFYFILERIISKENGKQDKKNYRLKNQYLFIIKRYNLDLEKIDWKLFKIGISFCNAFIISLVSTIVCILKMKIYYKYLIAFVLLFGLIYGVFELYGRYLNKKWGKKDE